MPDLITSVIAGASLLGKGGGGETQTSKTEIPEWLEEPSKRNVGRAEEISNIGYVPNYGPEIAAFNPQQIQAMQNTNVMANAYGMGPGINTMPDLPTPTDYGNGMMGYSSTGLFGEAVDQFAQERPGQYAAIENQFIDPVTGADPGSRHTLATSKRKGGGGGGGRQQQGTGPNGSVPTYMNAGNEQLAKRGAAYRTGSGDWVMNGNWGR